MARPKPAEAPVPASARPAYGAVVALTDTFCRQHLNEEYGASCRRLAGVLARKRPSPLTRGKPEVWACAIVRVIGWVNFLDDSSQTPHLKLTAVDDAFGVSHGTGQTKSKAIRDLLKIRQFDTEWTLPGRMERNPMAWLISVNGLILDARRLRREIQEEAYRKGLIPYIRRSPPRTSTRMANSLERRGAAPGCEAAYGGGSRGETSWPRRSPGMCWKATYAAKPRPT
jgi:hypothetical protein